MHELAVCQALLHQVEAVVAEHGATAADRIVISVGPLSGVEPALLASAFTIAREGTAAANAELDIESEPIEVECRTCAHRGTARPNRLLCGACGDWQVQVTRGEALMLLRVGLAIEDKPSLRPPVDEQEEFRHV